MLKGLGKGAQLLTLQQLDDVGMLREIKSSGLYVFSAAWAFLREREKKGGWEFEENGEITGF